MDKHTEPQLKKRYAYKKKMCRSEYKVISKSDRTRWKGTTRVSEYLGEEQKLVERGDRPIFRGLSLTFAVENANALHRFNCHGPNLLCTPALHWLQKLKTNNLVTVDKEWKN